MSSLFPGPVEIENLHPNTPDASHIEAHREAVSFSTWSFSYKALQYRSQVNQQRAMTLVAELISQAWPLVLSPSPIARGAMARSVCLAWVALIVCLAPAFAAAEADAPQDDIVIEGLVKLDGEQGSRSHPAATHQLPQSFRAICRATKNLQKMLCMQKAYRQPPPPGYRAGAALLASVGLCNWRLRCSCGVAVPVRLKSSPSRSW